MFYILPLMDCIKFGNYINLYKSAQRFLFFIYPSSILQLKYCNLFFLISNIGVIYPKYTISMGTFSIILKKKNKMFLIQLSSGLQKYFSGKFFIMLGRNAGIHKIKEYYGKASYNIFNKTIKSRSVAMNPIDHPNGGRTRGKMCFKTPWGKIAKHHK